jgi:hypothetical protein
MGMALFEVVWTTTVGIVVLVWNTELPLRQYINWANVHSHFSRVAQYPKVLVPEIYWRRTTLTWWVAPMTACTVFLFLGLGSEAVAEYKGWFTWVWTKVLRQKPRARRADRLSFGYVYLARSSRHHKLTHPVVAKKVLIQAHRTCPTWSSNGRPIPPQKSSMQKIPKGIRRGFRFLPRRTAAFRRQHHNTGSLIETPSRSRSTMAMVKRVVRWRRTSTHDQDILRDVLQGTLQILLSEAAVLSLSFILSQSRMHHREDLIIINAPNISFFHSHSSHDGLL